ncbi:Ubiquinone/menaquinone biosynthesis C-methyltransferase UbiE [bioreactor metagenome]|uniref:Ubiquinone/menaquinone biosynthesis C-methyltransferase UbiE n=1 Tax=bioreactor metagenome TaxID=1076179 RepID=A0A644WTH3_9ZZZZ|nr:class I SAM-dependent methyltransferase [Acidaminococcaceae bacterium]
MQHEFDIKNKKKLDSPKRREMLPTRTVLNKIGLNEGARLADIGCGIGYFSIPAAAVIGPQGIVFALDVSKEMIEELDKKIEENGIENIRTVITDKYNFKLEDNSVSYAFICTVLHEIEDGMAFINETKRILALGGKIAVVEWIRAESDWGPPVDHRLDSSDVKIMLQAAGFKEIEYLKLNEHFYIVTGTLVNK